MVDLLSRETILSSCRRYRYTLWREWPDILTEKLGFVAFVGLNPSTADEETNDPTIRRCISFAKDWGYTRFCMLNLFAFRATDPSVMRRESDPIGPDNDAHILRIASQADLVIAAWGCGGDFLRRAEHVRTLIPNLYCLKITKNGHPRHPLYLPRGLKPIPFGKP
jgi:hypothetical protein